MKTYLELTREANIILKQAEAARKRGSNQVIKTVLAMLESNGLTIDDLLNKAKRTAVIAPTEKRKVAIKYRSPNGDTWTGRGQQPKWLVALINQGHSREEFLLSH